MSSFVGEEHQQRQELQYIHYNPVKAGLCQYPENYKYSSAGFYELNEKDWLFLTHYKE
jgi:hypothetical protein